MRTIITFICLALTGCSTPSGDTRPADRPPQPLEQVNAEYPMELRKSGLVGEVLMEFTINAAGEVTDVNVVRATHPAFAEAATKAIRSWRFSPGIKQGIPVAVRTRVPIYFDVREELNFEGSAAPERAAGPRLNKPGND